MITMAVRKPKPHWLKKRLTSNPTGKRVRAILESGRLHTICDEARCPNQGDCYSRGTATFLILGKRCTRSCRFCAVVHGPECAPDPDEPLHVAETVRHLDLNYVVVTSVTRDDLPDGGASHFAETITHIRSLSPGTLIEVLIPDFRESNDALGIVIAAAPDVIGHNVETIPRLYPSARPGADYRFSLNVLKRTVAMNPGIPAKSGIMLGLGEEADEIRRTLSDIRETGCSLLWLGQYLQPDSGCIPVERYVTPDEFSVWRDEALEKGFSGVASGPFVRSSYQAEELYPSVKV
ncbi:lipoyl synthase [Candidatus Latescibacterota bacterium]